MPKGKNEKTAIPGTIQRSDKHAQAIYVKTHDSALETYGEDGEAVHRVAIASLKHSYKKQGDKWVKKARKGPSDPQSVRNQNTRKKSTDPDTAPSAGGEEMPLPDWHREDLYEYARQLDIEGRSRMKKSALVEAIKKKR